jgi:hypothetical protein
VGLVGLGGLGEGGGGGGPGSSEHTAQQLCAPLSAKKYLQSLGSFWLQKVCRLGHLSESFRHRLPPISWLALKLSAVSFSFPVGDLRS